VIEETSTRSVSEESLKESRNKSVERTTLFVVEGIDPEEVAQDEGGGAEISS
jgi:hypothetical protein